MALYGDMHIEETDCLHTFSPGAAVEKGVGLCYSTAGSGNTLGTQAGVVQLAAYASGLKVAGILLQDFVSVDETLYHLNYHKNVQNTGDPCEFMTKGWVVTNNVLGTPTLGDKAYMAGTGWFTPTKTNDAATPLVGMFGGKKDENGYAKVHINLPNSHGA